MARLVKLEARKQGRDSGNRNSQHHSGEGLVTYNLPEGRRSQPDWKLHYMLVGFVWSENPNRIRVHDRTVFHKVCPSSFFLFFLPHICISLFYFSVLTYVMASPFLLLSQFPATFSIILHTSLYTIYADRHLEDRGWVASLGGKECHPSTPSKIVEAKNI